MEEILIANVYCRKLDMHFHGNGKTLPVMNWLPKMHKTPTGSRFIVASKTCVTKGKRPYSCYYAKRHFEFFGGWVGVCFSKKPA